MLEICLMNSVNGAYQDFAKRELDGEQATLAIFCIRWVQAIPENFGG